MRRMLWFALGVVAFALAVLGVPLPVLPTTPFVLLAVFAFGNSSPVLAARVERSRLFGPAIADWREGGAIAPRTKALALATMAGVLVIGVALSVTTPVLVVQGIVMTAAAAFILSRPSGTTRR